MIIVYETSATMVTRTGNKPHIFQKRERVNHTLTGRTGPKINFHKRIKRSLKM